MRELTLNELNQVSGGSRIKYIRDAFVQSGIVEGAAYVYNAALKPSGATSFGGQMSRHNGARARYAAKMAEKAVVENRRKANEINPHGS